MESVVKIISDHLAWNPSRLSAFSKNNRVVFRQSGDLALLNYQDDIPNNHWNDFNRQCRGMVLDIESRRLVAHPYDKFFNIDSHPESRYDALPFASGYEISTKYDGTMVTAFSHDGKIGFATRSSFENSQTRTATRLFEERYPRLAKVPFEKYTMVFELVAPENRLIVPCDETDLILIGARDLQENRMMGYSEVAEIARAYDLRPPSIIKNDFESIFRIAKDGAGASVEEGWVVRFGTGLYVKMKTWQYLAHLQIQRLGLTKKQLARTYCDFDAAEWSDFVRKLPDGVQGAVEQFGREFQSKMNAFSDRMKKFYDKFSEMESQKEFALAIQKEVPKEFLVFLFCLRSGKSLEQAIREKHEEALKEDLAGEVIQPSMLKEWAFKEKD